MHPLETPQHQARVDANKAARRAMMDTLRTMPAVTRETVEVGDYIEMDGRVYYIGIVSPARAKIMAGPYDHDGTQGEPTRLSGQFTARRIAREMVDEAIRVTAEIREIEAVRQSYVDSLMAELETYAAERGVETQRGFELGSHAVSLDRIRMQVLHPGKWGGCTEAERAEYGREAAKELRANIDTRTLTIKAGLCPSWDSTIQMMIRHGKMAEVAAMSEETKAWKQPSIDAARAVLAVLQPAEEPLYPADSSVPDTVAEVVELIDTAQQPRQPVQLTLPDEYIPQPASVNRAQIEPQQRIYGGGREYEGVLRGQRITGIDDLKVGRLLIKVSHQFKAENLVRVVNIEPDRKIAYCRYHPNTGEVMAIWHHELTDGNDEYYKAEVIQPLYRTDSSSTDTSAIDEQCVRNMAQRCFDMAVKHHTHPQNIARELNLDGIYAQPARCVWDDGQTIVMPHIRAQIEAMDMMNQGIKARVVLVTEDEQMAEVERIDSVSVNRAQVQEKPAWHMTREEYEAIHGPTPRGGFSEWCELKLQAAAAGEYISPEVWGDGWTGFAVSGIPDNYHPDTKK